MPFIKNEGEFIRILKEIETDVKKFKRTYINPSCGAVFPRMQTIFNNHIDLNAATPSEVDYMIKLLKSHNFHYRIESLVIAELIFRMDEMKNKNLLDVRERVVKYHVYKMIG